MTKIRMEVIAKAKTKVLMKAITQVKANPPYY